GGVVPPPWIAAYPASPPARPAVVHTAGPHRGGGGGGRLLAQPAELPLLDPGRAGARGGRVLRGPHGLRARAARRADRRLALSPARARGGRGPGGAGLR